MARLLLLPLLLIFTTHHLIHASENDLLDRVRAAKSSNKLNDKLTDEQGATLLIVAAREGYANAVSQLLSQPVVDKDAQEAQGRSALIAAIAAAHPTLAISLVSAGCNVNLIDVEGKDALMWAARQGHVAVLELLVRRGAALTNRDQDGYTALHHAAEGNQAATATELLKQPDVNPHTRSNVGHTALHVCAARGHAEVCRALLRQSNSSVDRFDHGGWTPLLHAVKGGHVAVATTLLKDGHAHANVGSRRRDESSGESPLMAAVRADATSADRLVLVKQLLAARAHVNYRQRAYVHHGHHRAHAVTQAVPQPLAPQGTGRRDGAPTALCIAAARGDADVCRALLDAGAHVAAACNPHAYLVAGPGAAPSRHNDTLLLTPLELARKGGHAAAAALLLQRLDAKTPAPAPKPART